MRWLHCNSEVRKMFETLRYLYEKGRITAAALERAIGLGWITAEQKQEIVG